MRSKTAPVCSAGNPADPRAARAIADGRVESTAAAVAVVAARIAEIIPRGEFATWCAARAVGDYDLNTFLIRADPIGGAEGLQPGMTVWLHRQ